jgi:hypothetical protein
MRDVTKRARDMLRLRPLLVLADCERFSEQRLRGGIGAELVEE